MSPTARTQPQTHGGRQRLQAGEAGQTVGTNLTLKDLSALMVAVWSWSPRVAELPSFREEICNMSSAPCASRKERMTDVGEGAGQSLDTLPLSATDTELGPSCRPTSEAAPGPPESPPGCPSLL